MRGAEPGAVEKRKRVPANSVKVDEPAAKRVKMTEQGCEMKDALGRVGRGE